MTTFLDKNDLPSQAQIFYIKIDGNGKAFELNWDKNKITVVEAILSSSDQEAIDLSSEKGNGDKIKQYIL